MKHSSSRVKRNGLGFDAIKIKKQLKSLPAGFDNWINNDGDPALEPIINLPTYFLYLEELLYGMSADVWGYLSIEYSINAGYCVYENNYSNTLMCALEENYKILIICSFSWHKVLRHCGKFYKNKRVLFPKDHALTI